nr:molecular chaperone [Burkholderia anthina]
MLAAVALTFITETQVASAATSVMIWPIDPVIENDQRAAALWLENRDTTSVTLQIRLLGWRQENGQDQYSGEQNRVASSPPMVTVLPGQRQLIRLIKLTDVSPETEGAYRVLIDEIPQPKESEEGSGGASLGVKFQMHYSIPLFVYGAGISAKQNSEKSGGPTTTALPMLGWHLAEEGGVRWLVMTNRGQMHARITQVAFDLDGQRTEFVSGMLGYVLPGAQMRWRLPAGLKLREHSKLIATINGKAEIEIERTGFGDLK